MSSNFFAMISRLKYIDRWALMRNTRNENLSEHSMETAVIAHVLAIIGNKRYSKNYDADRVAMLGLYHDAPEILTGDMPTPVKYYSKELRNAYAKAEENACKRLAQMLPEDLRDEFMPFFFAQSEDEELWKLVKAADRFSALIKCIEEEKAGNREFRSAYISIKESITQLNMPEADDFLKEFIPGYSLALDEIKL